MPDIERLDDWKGQDVLDRDGDRVGKLAEVYFPVGGNEPIMGAVKVGKLGGKHHLVPLTDISISRGYVRIPGTKDQVKAAPTVGSPANPTPDEEAAFLQHFQMDDPGAGAEGRRFDSTESAKAREAEILADLRRADELEAEAARRASEAERAEGEASDARSTASEARSDEARLTDEARRLRDEAEGRG